MALSINLKNLIKNETIENERIEYKKGWNPEDIMHSICAFANDINNWGGGYILIGIEGNEGLPVLPPVGIEPEQVDAYQRKLLEICNKINPSYTPIVSPDKFEKKNVLVIYAPGGDNRPYDAPRSFSEKKSQRAYWVRKGSCTVIASLQDRQRLLELAKKVPFDDRRSPTATIEDLSLPIIQAFLREVHSELYEESSKIPFDELCRKMNIARGSSEDLRPINVGLLLFTEKPNIHFRGCTTEVILYKDAVGKVFEESKFSSPIHMQLRNVLDFIKTNVIKEKVIKIKGQPEVKRIYNYPYEALEEATANAIYHRSYEVLNSIEINVRQDRIEILSFPGPLPPLNKKILKETRIVARDYRNRRIGDFLRELHLTEGRGTGIPTIRDAMKGNNSPAPIFETDNDLTYFLTILPCNLFFVDLELDDYKKSILDFCRNAKSRSEIMDYIGLKNRQDNATRHLQPLIDAGYISYLYPHVPQTPKQKYVLTDKGKEKLST